ncbi:AAA family ATPase [Candidatus Woesearchaeota archaeon]|nr:AAA family ATPase [Candidatus Woesearchaeota archaeon]
MGLFDDMLKDSESLFLNEMELDYDYVPKIVKYREDQQQHMATCIKPLFQNRNGTHLLITGRSGIGKTVAVKKVFEDLEKETLDIIPIYINCWKKDTFYKIALHICEKVGYKWVHNKKGDELFKEACALLNKKKVVFCFDEVDKLEEQSILYSVVEDVYKKSIFMVTNEKDWLAKLDQRIRSRMIPEILEFEPYNYDETKGILEQRKESAFVSGIWDDDAFEKVVEKTVELGDIRVGLHMLRESGNAAEIKSSKKIRMPHVESAVKKLDSFKIRDSKDLGEEENFIIELVKAKPDINLVQLYEDYKKKYNQSYRTLQRKVADLEGAGLLSVKESTTKQGGKTSSLNVASKKLTEF